MARYVFALLIIGMPAALHAQNTSLGPRRAAISAQSTTSPGSTPRPRGGVSISSSSSGSSFSQDSSTMSAPAFPRITNVGTTGSTFNNSNTARASSPPSLFGRSSTEVNEPGFFTADSRPGMERSSRTIYQPGVLRVVKGSGTLPSDGGQVWREYDISPYTSRAKNQEKPEQAVIDWVLRETGSDVWFSEPLGILSAGRTTLRVYHTPQMQELVNDVVKRLVESDMEPHTLAVRVMTVSSPAWRTRALPLMRSIDIQSPGVEAWLLSRENAAVLVGELRQRGDYRENVTPNLQIQSGQTETISRTRPRVYPRTVRQVSYYPGIEMVNGQIEEGFAMQLSPLMSLDGKTCDAAIKCNIDQVERLVPVNIDVNIGGQPQRAQIQVPQLVSWRFQERFRWPADQVLLLSCGVVASPSGNSGGSTLPLLGPLLQSGERADALLMVECRGKASETGLDFGLPPAAQAAMRNSTPATVITANSNPGFTTPSTSPYVRRQY